MRVQEEDGQANLAQEEESNLMLLQRGEIFELAPLASAANSNSPVSKNSLALAAAMGLARLMATTGGPVHLVKEKAFTQFQ
jgi:hypothetical protein